MNKLLALTIAACAISPAFATTNVGVSIGINQPGMYGRIDIGNFPAPAVIYPQPVVYAPSPVAVYQRPIYLYVPPGHQKNWGKHCGYYSACGQPVYFVRESWVRERYEHEHEHDHGNEHGHEHEHDGGKHGKGRH